MPSATAASELLSRDESFLSVYGTVYILFHCASATLFVRLFVCPSVCLGICLMCLRTFQELSGPLFCFYLLGFMFMTLCVCIFLSVFMHVCWSASFLHTSLYILYNDLFNFVSIFLLHHDQSSVSLPFCVSAFFSLPLSILHYVLPAVPTPSSASASCSGMMLASASFVWDAAAGGQWRHLQPYQYSCSLYTLLSGLLRFSLIPNTLCSLH